MTNIQILKGNILFTPSMDELKIYPSSYIIVEDGKVKGVFEQLPEKYREYSEIEDFNEQLIIPGFVDLHVHAPQYYQSGIGLDYELIEWLNNYTFPSENKINNLDYANEIYSEFVDELVRQGTLRACIFATIHKESTVRLFEIIEKKGIGAYIGKVNMDRNCPDFLCEDTGKSIMETEELIEKYKDNPLVKPILTPRFAPTSSNKLLTEIGKLAQKHGIPVQSHLSENVNEVKWVSELFPSCSSYSNVYNMFKLFGQTPTLMAHGIYLNEDELTLIKENDVMLVHCPDSNLNISSGIMPIRKWLEKGIKVGLGSDVGGGHSLSMPKTLVRAVQLSKLMKVLDKKSKPLTVTEAFYMITKGGGRFFGKVGSFEKGYAFDALIIDDNKEIIKNLTIEERLQRFLYVGDDRNIIARYVEGKKI